MRHIRREHVVKWLYTMGVAVILLLAAAIDASAQSDRFVGVRKDSANEIILFSIDALTGAENKIATLETAQANILLLGMTALNSRRGTFSYAYTDRAAGKDYLHTVSVLNGQTVSRIALPADTSGLEVVVDVGRQETQAQTEALRRKVEWLEQEVRRLQGQVRLR
jgi:hypothetical protein